MTSVSIIKSGGANYTSITACLDRLGVCSTITDDIKTITNSTHVILPGVGAAKNAMDTLTSQGILGAIPRLKQPVLGICLGMQLLCENSEEGDVSCLGIFTGKVVKIKAAEKIRVPHMGWNEIDLLKIDHTLLKGIKNGTDFYFVHSYAVAVDPLSTLASCDYGCRFSAVMGKDNFYGVQFHPEKSGVNGQKLLKNFLEIT